jgi:aspartyl-tRNA(Asn)/glutamyl-tRNA(Gln) amidotransferase subunit A
MNRLDSLTIAELAPRIAAREVSCLEAAEACLARIADGNGRLNAFITIMAEQARTDARRADAEIARGGYRGPLHGIPVSVKDLIDVAGVPTTAASRLLADHVPAADAPVVAHLREAGAVIIGKCNLHEFAFGTTSEDSAYGPVRNPCDPSRSAGGSSGGSAAAVASGMCFASVGTDTGGSIRIPAALCGCVGLKPTSGELPCDGIVPLSRTLDHVGPLARSVGDAWLTFQALSGARCPEPLRGTDRRPPQFLRLGVLRPYFMDLLADDVREQVEFELGRLARAGIVARERVVPHAGDVATVYLHLQLPEASAFHAEALERHPDAYTPPVRLRLELGRYVLAEDYVRALRGRDVLRGEVDAALEGCDALVLPTVPITAAPIGSTTLPVGGEERPVRALMLRLTQLFDITGHPAISLPCGHSRANLPVGLQLVGRRHATADLVATAAACETVLAARD